jgi:hypothetical protein
MTVKCDLCKYEKKGYGENPCAVCLENQIIENQFKPKEPELMTLQEAVGKSKDNDLIKHHSVFGLEFMKKHHEDYKVSVFRAIGRKWQIIPAEPKVLSVDEWEESVDLDDYSIQGAFETGDQNGQLKQWLNHKELRERVEKFTRLQSPHHPLRITLENIKPLKAE